MIIRRNRHGGGVLLEMLSKHTQMKTVLLAMGQRRFQVGQKSTISDTVQVVALAK